MTVIFSILFHGIIITYFEETGDVCGKGKREGDCVKWGWKSWWLWMSVNQGCSCQYDIMNVLILRMEVGVFTHHEVVCNFVIRWSWHMAVLRWKMYVWKLWGDKKFKEILNARLSPVKERKTSLLTYSAARENLLILQLERCINSVFCAWKKEFVSLSVYWYSNFEEN